MPLYKWALLNWPRQTGKAPTAVFVGFAGGTSFGNTSERNPKHGASRAPAQGKKGSRTLDSCGGVTIDPKQLKKSSFVYF